MLRYQFHFFHTCGPYIHARFSLCEPFKCKLWAGIIALWLWLWSQELGRAVELTLVGSTLLFGEKKGSKRYMTALASSALAKKAFESCQRRLNPFETNVSKIHKLLDDMESQNKTLQSRFVSLLSLPRFHHLHKTTTLDCTLTIGTLGHRTLVTNAISQHLAITMPHASINHNHP